MKNLTMTFGLLLSVACIGCDRKSGRKVEPSQPVQVNAPGVQVNVDPQDGVRVKAPGVDIETK